MAGKSFSPPFFFSNSLQTSGLEDEVGSMSEDFFSPDLAMIFFSSHSLQTSNLKDEIESMTAASFSSPHGMIVFVFGGGSFITVN